MKTKIQNITSIYLWRKCQGAIAIIILALLCCPLQTAANPGSGGKWVDWFSSQSNSFQRVQVLSDLGKEAVPYQETIAVLELALTDSQPNVVVAAAKQIGSLKYADLEDQLILTYENARDNFQGYAERVQIECIRSMAKIGGKNTASFLAEALARDNGTVKGSEVLTAIGELKDPELIEALQNHITKMDGLIKRGKAAGHNPMLYSLALQHKAQAETTIELLKAVKGGK